MYYFFCFRYKICKFITEISEKFSQSILLCDAGGIVIWYLMDCHGLKETDVLMLGKKYLSRAAVSDVFMLTYDRMRRYEGTWHMEKKLLYPSYVFLESENEKLLTVEFGEFQFQVFSKNIGGLVRINSDVEKFLKYLYGDEYHMEMSQGIIRDGSTQVLSGPLRGMERRICRIDRHRRLAKLSLGANGKRKGEMQADDRRQGPDLGYIMAGLEITDKI